MLNGTSYGNKINVSINAVALSVRQKSQQEDHILSNWKNSYLIMTDKSYVSSRPTLIFHSIYICLHQEIFHHWNLSILFCIQNNNNTKNIACTQYFELIKIRKKSYLLYFLLVNTYIYLRMINQIRYFMWETRI